ncbi:MAG: Cna B-type domain-containing protein [Clostridiales bacterium]|nr:Cna B-type domain-containing protein [Clostridiales bacterium]
MKMNQGLCRLSAGLLSLLMLFCLSQNVVAAGISVPGAMDAVDTSRKGSVRIVFSDEEQPVAKTPFSLYRVAEISSEAQFLLTEDFMKYHVSLDNLDSEGWRVLANTLSGYVSRDQLSPMAHGETDDSGALTFSGLSVGLYLVVGEPHKAGEWLYTPQPFLICLPSPDRDGNWKYNTVAEPKYDRRQYPQDETVQRRALKVWKDDGEERPKEIVVQLLQNGKVYEEATLNADNNWNHTWNRLNAEDHWQLVEKTVPDHYTVTVEQQDMTFVITNTRSGSETSSSAPPDLPKTGQLWWPVPVLAGLGVIAFLTGWLKYRKGGKCHDASQK